MKNAKDNAQITNIKRSIMGTIRFDAKFTGMRTPQDFIVYPISENDTGNIIYCQSDSRWLEIDKNTGEAEITSSQSGHHNRWLLVLQRAAGKSKKFTLSPIDLSTLKMHIFTTADKKAGNNVISTDNSGAINIL